MDLAKVSNEQKLYLCRWYYIGGFFFLPFLWCVNGVWFFNEAFKKPPFEEQPRIKTYVIRSIIGTVIWSIVLVTWIAIFQTNRADLGEVADRISFIIPIGIP
ncbi:Gamma-secretase subunit pen-2 [Chamberlinius hualienensis]